MQSAIEHRKPCSGGMTARWPGTGDDSTTLVQNSKAAGSSCGQNQLCTISGRSTQAAKVCSTGSPQTTTCQAVNSEHDKRLARRAKQHKQRCS